MTNRFIQISNLPLIREGLLGIILSFLVPFIALAQEDIRLGAYYFDGWTGKTFHATKKLKADFPERKPIWGWLTSTPEIMQKQIDLASNSGISFFSFCWYQKSKHEGGNLSDDPKNQALHLFLKAKNKRKLNFNLLVANHKGYKIYPEDWESLCRKWIRLFKDPSYLKLDGKPLITFFEVKSLVESFGSSDGVSKALDTFRELARDDSLEGVMIAACVYPDPAQISLAERCNFDVLTGYNYHDSGLQKARTGKLEIDSMRTAESRVWNFICASSTKPFIPAITLNWDQRPWEESQGQTARFVGYSQGSVVQSIRSCRTWMNGNDSKLTSTKLAVIYAWNEYGEGAWLTPSKILKNSLLNGVKEGLDY
ncbi:glycoside hydrolase family 99-like domain-containing protein [Dyadobacter alkalitolerans]|uniref:glycoside hydrolase family 99-like domain-containing protein n=1 Tax=Dyadobacter alkalitolerans TaxID=492736 RepID=UPI00040CD90B|nr:glycoside hydrolase family 99-like domain-containing protein [Dyadobacter alkalitolerans]